MPLLDVHGLVKFYGRRKVVDGVSFTVEPGEVVGLLGPNGAGKTTSFRMTTGQIVPNDGRVTFNGEDVTGQPMYQRARRGMGYLSQEPSVFKKLSVERNLLAILEVLPRSRTLGRRLTRSERWDRTDEALRRFKLDHVRKNVAGRCSGGEKRRLEIARCLVCEPLLILLDEPFAAVDPLTTEDIRKNIRELAGTGIGILLTDHNVREVLKITDRSYLIKDGKVVCHGTPDQVIRDPVAIRDYLGSTFSEDPLGRKLVAVDDLPAEVAALLAKMTGVAQTRDTRQETRDKGGEPSPAGQGVKPEAAKAEPVKPAPVVFEPPPAPRAVPHAAPPKGGSGLVHIAPYPPEEDDADAFAAWPDFPQATPPADPPAPRASASIPVPDYPPPPPPRFTGATGALVEQEKLRRLVEALADDGRLKGTMVELVQKGDAAVPLLLEVLERRGDKSLRERAFELLKHIAREPLVYDADAADDVRLRQVAHLRVKLERRRSA